MLHAGLRSATAHVRSTPAAVPLRFWEICRTPSSGRRVRLCRQERIPARRVAAARGEEAGPRQLMAGCSSEIPAPLAERSPTTAIGSLDWIPSNIAQTRLHVGATMGNPSVQPWRKNPSCTSSASNISVLAIARSNHLHIYIGEYVGVAADPVHEHSVVSRPPRGLSGMP